MRFARAAKEIPDVRKALEQVALFEANTQEEAGAKLQETYGAKGTPHFLLMTADGNPFGRWRGYASPGSWVGALDAALSDRTPIAEKAERFKAAPNEALAGVLGRIRSAESDWKASVFYFREARRLAGRPVAEYADSIFEAVYSGQKTGDFSTEDVRAAADGVMSEGVAEPEMAAYLGVLMAGLAKETSDPRLLEPYLDWGLKKSEALSGPVGAELRTDLRIAEALQVRHDPARALSIKRSAMPAGWEDDAEKLNEIAWWCFENRVALDEAERYARKGIALAKDGKMKADILDTAAEICNLRDNCRESVALITEAVKADPDREHYRKQLARFRELLARKNG